MGTTNARDMRAPGRIHFECRYFLPEGIARKAMNKAATKKKIVSFVSSPIPSTTPARIQSLGSFRRIILITRYPSSDHHKQSSESGVKIVPKARRSSEARL